MNNPNTINKLIEIILLDRSEQAVFEYPWIFQIQCINV